MKTTLRRFAAFSFLCTLAFPLWSQLPTDTVSIHILSNFWKTGAPNSGFGISFSGQNSQLPLPSFIEEIPAPDTFTRAYRYIPGTFDAQTCILAHKGGGVLNGVTVADLVRISQHILGTDPLPLGPARIAADVNKSNSISSFDIIELKKLILGIYQEFPNQESWAILPAAYFANPVPFYCEELPLNPTQLLDTAQFISIKIGDVDGDANPSGLFQPSGNTYRSLGIPNTLVQQGETRWVPIVLTAETSLSGFQIGFKYDEDLLEVKGVRSSNTEFSANNVGLFSKQVSIVGVTPMAETKYFEANSILAEIEIEALQTFNLAQAFSISSDRLPGLWVDADGKPQPFDTSLAMTSTQFEPLAQGVRIGTPSPNPFVENTAIPIQLETPAQVHLILTDVAGRQLQTKMFDLSAGAHLLEISGASLPSNGLVFYRIWTDNWTDSGQVLKL